MPREKTTVTCECCGNAFILAGLGPHRKSCIRRARRAKEDNAYLETLRQASSSASQQSSGIDNPGPPARLHASSGLQQDICSVPVEVDPPADVANAVERTVCVGINGNNVDDILVGYHSSTARSSEEIPSVESAQGRRPRTYKLDVSADPRYPLRSPLDLEFAELALEAALSKEQVNRFLKLMKSVRCGDDLFTLNDYADLHSTWRAASHRMTASSSRRN
ncbi:hypothetical protein EDD16DRAFT_1567574 [Pisolithus croceorrhizus]|nr:hypothetical protein EDD16DRAFT_1567574 [Pisolithus croceorrhizus]